MARQIKSPDVDRANLDDWLLSIYRVSEQSGGFICLELTNMDNSGKPEIKAGSRFELNNSIFVAGPGNEEVKGAASTGQCYIYAKHEGNPNNVPESVREKLNNGLDPGSIAGFYFGSDEPVWDAARGGWFSRTEENSRAIVKFFYTSGQYNGKVILDSYNAMFMVNVRQVFPDSGSNGVAVTIPGYSSNSHAQFNGMIDLAPGIYRYELKGGSGGAGGDGGANPSSYPDDGASGGNGGGGEFQAGTFAWRGGKIQVTVGADGGNGGNGGDGASDYEGVLSIGGNGGGGGGGLDSRIGAITARGGKPGIGGKRTHSYFANVMPGSPGGYGIGGNGGENLVYGIRDNRYRPGGRGEGPKNTTSGYARLWRVG